jgi:hypothetical protein
MENHNLLNLKKILDGQEMFVKRAREDGAGEYGTVTEEKQGSARASEPYCPPFCT